MSAFADEIDVPDAPNTIAFGIFIDPCVRARFLCDTPRSVWTQMWMTGYVAPTSFTIPPHMVAQDGAYARAVFKHEMTRYAALHTWRVPPLLTGFAMSMVTGAVLGVCTKEPTIATGITAFFAGIVCAETHDAVAQYLTVTRAAHAMTPEERVQAAIYAAECVDGAGNLLENMVARVCARAY